MEQEQVIELAKENIRQAIKDYGEHTSQTRVLDDISEGFVNRLAKDSTRAKWELRELFRKSPVWDEKLSALVINGTRTHNPDYDVIYNLAQKILDPASTTENRSLVYGAINFFARPFDVDANKVLYKRALEELAPKAYAPNKKLSRVFKALCVELGVADETAGSEFQRLYAQFADELTAKRIGFKLYVSINPAHFLTMSNPKNDERGDTLTSCHSFNSTEYEYNNGCAGYARDSNTFIVFTVSDPNNPETFNNRKTTRQIFAYKPGNGLLIQSRFYNTSGGTRGAQEDSKLYRDLVQREISMLENAPNLWKTYSTYNTNTTYAYTGCDFGGYPDWIYQDFDGKASVRADHADDYEALEIGKSGLCICCADEMSYSLYCSGCKGSCDDDDDEEQCYECDNYYSSDDLYRVYDNRGNEVYVCYDCRNSYYTECDCCGEYVPNDCVSETGDGDYVCNSCLERNYQACEDCENLFRENDLYEVEDIYGHSVCVCADCRDENYIRCHECGECYANENVTAVTLSTGEYAHVCKDCCDENYSCCDECGGYYPSENVDEVIISAGETRHLCKECAEKCGIETEPEKEAEAV